MKNQRFGGVLKEAQTGFEPVNQGVADPRLTTWLLRLIILNIKIDMDMKDCQYNLLRQHLNYTTTYISFQEKNFPRASGEE